MKNARFELFDDILDGINVFTFVDTFTGKWVQCYKIDGIGYTVIDSDNELEPKEYAAREVAALAIMVALGGD